MTISRPRQKPCANGRWTQSLRLPRIAGTGALGLYKEELTLAALPRYIFLPDAAKRLGKTKAELNRLVATGKIKAIKLNGESAVSEDALPLRKEDLPGYKRHASLGGIPT